MDKKHFKIMPILNKETTAIWTAWTHMGNREVSREAVAKGTHVALAIQFLAIRNEISQIDAETWFKNEVLMWVKELLSRKQIHRSKHILTNAGIEPMDELHNIFLKTDSKESRKYIGDHLLDLKQMDEHTKNLWNFLEIIHSNRSSITNYSDCNSVEELHNKSPEWCSKVATVLFLIVYDF
ncbi:hypothetical protein HHI36_001216 [Cryptolaemus montrouzieri]|uniref:Uncharacterized protein n=1 Tax=Cryptolaemus montrouzieri TaxID=559131 RepID=A0ABD2P746_9CUCU